MTTGKTVALTRQVFVDKVMSLLFNMLSRLVITFLPRSKRLNFMAAVTICKRSQTQKDSCSKNDLTVHVLIHRRRQWQPTPVLLPGKSHGRRSRVGCSPWGRQESHTTERLHFHFSLSCIAEGNGNPLQCSCLENPREERTWRAAVYGVAQNRTRLKRLSSSSSVDS